MVIDHTNIILVVHMPYAVWSLYKTILYNIILKKGYSVF